MQAVFFWWDVPESGCHAYMSTHSKDDGQQEVMLGADVNHTNLAGLAEKGLVKVSELDATNLGTASNGKN